MKEPLQRYPRKDLGFAGTGLLLALTIGMGCTVGPDYRPQLSETPPAWTGATPAPDSAAQSNATASLATWWTAFQDPTLSSLVTRAIAANLDLSIAAARVRQARASRGASTAALGPSADVSGSLRRSQGSGSSATDADERQPTTNQYQAGFDAAWELDVVGGVRRGVEAADADLLAAEEARQGTVVTLVAEVARDYIDLRASQQRLVIAQQNLALQRHTTELTRRRHQNGFVSGLDVANAEAQSASTAAQIPLLETSTRQAIYSLSLLLGLPPNALLEELSPVAAVPVAPPAVPLGVPSDLLRRRPDIRQAEAAIHGATARIGVATAELYPHFTLSGALGYQAVQASDVFDPLSRFWSLGPAITWRLLDSGRIRADVELQKALEEQSVIAYRQTVLTALQEVESALFSSTKEQEHGQALTQALDAYRHTATLAETLYQNGETDFLNVLTAQRSLQAAEDALAQSTAALSTDLVALYKALGGGWDTQTVAPDADSQTAP